MRLESSPFSVACVPVQEKYIDTNSELTPVCSLKLKSKNVIVK